MQVDQFSRELLLYYQSCSAPSDSFKQSSKCTSATALATLSQAVKFLKDTAREQQYEAQSICSKVSHILKEIRRGEDGLWPKKNARFHWTLSAVEALMRYASFVPDTQLTTSDEKLLLALAKTLEHPRVKKVLHEVLLGELRKAGRSSVSLRRGNN